MENSFINLIKEGNLLKIIEFYNDNPFIDISTDGECAFCYACEKGYLEVAKWLLEIKPNINISTNYNYAFCHACMNGHLDVVKWILEVEPNINISINYEYVLCCSYRNGHLEVSKLLLDLKQNNEYLFRYACYYGYLDIAKWLLEIKPDINNSVNNNIFIVSCDNSRLEVEQWLKTVNENYKIIDGSIDN